MQALVGIVSVFWCPQWGQVTVDVRTVMQGISRTRPRGDPPRWAELFLFGERCVTCVAHRGADRGILSSANRSRRPLEGTNMRTSTLLALTITVAGLACGDSQGPGMRPAAVL